jgi:hypothetical protein
MQEGRAATKNHGFTSRSLEHKSNSCAVDSVSMAERNTAAGVAIKRQTAVICRKRLCGVGFAADGQAAYGVARMSQGDTVVLDWSETGHKKPEPCEGSFYPSQGLA